MQRRCPILNARGLAALCVAVFVTPAPRAQAGINAWTTSQLPQRGMVHALVIDPHTPSVLYAGTYGPGTVFKSTDSGTTWRDLLPGQDVGVFALALNPLTPGTLYTGARTPIRAST